MIRSFVLALLLAASPAAFADLYKCVDARGKTQYSDKPLPGCKGAAPITRTPKAAEPAKAESRAFSDRNQFAREQVVRCGQARQSYRRGQASDSVRETLRDCM